MIPQVILKDGTTLAADLVVAGVGVEPASGFLKDTGIKLNSRGFAVVNEVRPLLFL